MQCEEFQKPMACTILYTLEIDCTSRGLSLSAPAFRNAARSACLLFFNDSSMAPHSMWCDAQTLACIYLRGIEGGPSKSGLRMPGALTLWGLSILRVPPMETSSCGFEDRPNGFPVKHKQMMLPSIGSWRCKPWCSNCGPRTTSSVALEHLCTAWKPDIRFTHTNLSATTEKSNESCFLNHMSVIDR